MAETSPELVHAYRLARAGASRGGEIAVSRMSRLASLLCDDQGAARYQLDFYLDAQSRVLVSGRVQATLAVICQRCLEPMHLDLDLELRLGIVRSDEEAIALAKQYEPLMVTDDAVSLATLVEDELILGLPTAPLHPAGSCRPPLGIQGDEPTSGVGQVRDLGGGSRKDKKANG